MSKTPTTLRERTKELAHDIEHGYLELAKNLYSIRNPPPGENPLYAMWGYQTWQEYVDQELSFSLRKAQMLNLIWHKLTTNLATIPPALKKRLVSLGWSKVKELVKVLSVQNADKWIQMAETNSCTEVEKAVSDYFNAVKDARQAAVEKGENPEDVAPGVPVPESSLGWFHCRVSNEQKATLELAIERAAALTDKQGEVHKGVNLEYAALDFLATNDLGKSSTEDKLRILAKMERLMGIKLIAVSADYQHVLLGLDTMERLFAKNDAPKEVPVVPEPGVVV